MHYSTPDGWHKQKRLNKIKDDHFLCHICPLHGGENERKSWNPHNAKKFKYKK